MKISINQRHYEASACYMTLLRYRLDNGKSFFKSDGGKAACINLLYAAIQGDKPDYRSFQTDCMIDDSFSQTVSNFYKQELLRNKPVISDTAEVTKTGDTDEFYILALAVNCKIPEAMLGILNLFEVIMLIEQCCDIKSGKTKPKEMQSTERKGFYGITPEKEKEIEAYILAHRGSN